VTLLASVAATLESAGIAFALIGAGALAVHRVARATGDLVLLELYAAGPQDLWDIQRLLDAAPDKASLLAAVESGLTDLGESARAAWRQVLRN
jgi:hypothetical protein